MGVKCEGGKRVLEGGFCGRVKGRGGGVFWVLL